MYKKENRYHKLVLATQQNENIVMMLMLLCFDVIEQKTVFLRGLRCIIDNKEVPCFEMTSLIFDIHPCLMTQIQII